MRTKTLFRVAIISVAAILFSGGAALAADYEIREILIEGLERVPESTIREAIQVSSGQDLLRRDVQLIVREDVRRVAKLEGVQDVTVSTEAMAEGVRLIYEIREYPLISDLRFRGNRKYDDHKLKRELEFIQPAGFFSTETMEVFYSPLRVRDYLEQLRQLYAKKGFADAEITHTLEDSTEDSVVVAFDIDEGHALVIRDVAFDGNEAFRDKKLRKQIKTKKSWVPFFPKRYKQPEIDDDVLRLTRFYEDQGYYRVNVRQGENEVLEGGKRVIVHFEISEGPLYEFGQVRVTGNRVFSDEEILTDLYVQPGKTFNRTELEKDTYNIGELYRSQGYLYTNVEPFLSARDEEQLVDITWQIAESARYRLRNIELQGIVTLEDGTTEEVPLKTKDFVILREIELESGDVLDWTEVRESERNLLNLGYFKREPESIPARLAGGFDPEAAEGEEDLLDLRLKLEEEPTGLVTFGGGFSTTYGPTIFASVEERNLFGRGWRTNVSGNIGGRKQSARVSFTDPHIFHSDYLFGVDLYHTFREAFGGREFDETRTGGSIRLGKEIYENLYASVRYKFESIEIEDIDVTGLQDTVRPDPYVEGTSTTSSITFSLTHDTRDYVLNPSSGHRYAGSLEIAGLGGDNEFWKLIGNASWYRLLTEKLILAYDVEAGIAQGFGTMDSLPLHERFFSGGANSIRGFEEAGIGPRGIYARTRRLDNGQVYSEVDDVVIGGEIELLSRTELRYPITNQVQGVVFFDAGAAWEEIGDVDFGEIRMSTGVGVRVNLPIGAAIRLDLGVPILKEEEDDTQFFHFGFNQSF
jgi:outer membrane protein insertion porin family